MNVYEIVKQLMEGKCIAWESLNTKDLYLLIDILARYGYTIRTKNGLPFACPETIN